MDDAENDRHLHLEGVEEGQLVGGNVPDLAQRKHRNEMGEGGESENDTIKMAV